MFAPVRLFLNPRRQRGTVRLLALAATGACLSGCGLARFEDVKMDPQSPLAPAVAKAEQMRGDYPSFSEIPLKPTDLRPARAYGQSADEVKQARLDLERATAPETFTLKETDAFARSAQVQAGPEIDATQPNDTEAFARDLRKRATPPPSPKR